MFSDTVTTLMISFMNIVVIRKGEPMLRFDLRMEKSSIFCTF